MATTTVTVIREVTDGQVAAYLRPRSDLVEEDEGRHEDQTVTYGLVDGPFTAYERRVETHRRGPDDVLLTQTTTFTLEVGFWSFMFLWLMRRAFRRPGGRTPWWAPPQVLDAPGAASLASLASLSLIAGYMGTLITQTLTFAADEFGAGDRAQGDTLAAVRIGVLLSMLIAAWADRHGRRRALLWCAGIGVVVTSLGALAPGMIALGGSQLVARGLATALALLIVVVVAEEMPAGSRAYGVSLLTMTGGLGAGMVLWLLPLADIAGPAWRILYVAPLLFLPLVRSTARLLPESRRFIRRHGPARFAGHGRRLALLAGSALLLAVFSSPASQLQNEFLRDEFSFSAAQITLFTLVTVTPGSIGIVIGGRLADTRGKRLIGAIGVAGGAAFTVLQYLTDSALTLWAASAMGSVIGGLAVPALSVYGPELFPTALRTRANVIITVLGVAGSVLGLLVAGRLAERWSLGPGIATLAVGPALVVLALIPRYPETAHRELEELNPEDALGVPSIGLGP